MKNESQSAGICALLHYNKTGSLNSQEAKKKLLNDKIQTHNDRKL